jgi:uncharacterized protein (TIGR02444 family)
MSEARPNPFWDFSLALWGREGVAPACLALQERRGLDVNLLLYCCWAGGRGRALADTDIAALIEAVGPWRARVVLPLREVRHRLKDPQLAPEGPAQELRERVKALELEAERIQQDLMLAALDPPEGGRAPALAAGNLVVYVTALGFAREAVDQDDLAVLLTGAFPDMSLADARRLLPG